MIKKRFEPKPDITAYELARIVALMIFPSGAAVPMAHVVRFSQPDFDNFDDDIKRHFVEP